MAVRPSLEKIPNLSSHKFIKPVKRIHDGPDVTFFLTSLAYRDIMVFMLQLNHAMVPRKTEQSGSKSVSEWKMNSSDISYSEPVQSLRKILKKLQSLINDAPPDTGPRRFGNISFRKWYDLVVGQIRSLLQESLPLDTSPAFEELEAYLLGSFGSPQRLDYGTGHELSFLTFLACLWKMDYFQDSDPGVEERAIVLGVFEEYLALIRTLIQTYTLEPAGSHGVWGLDDNSFLPYVFGSAQYCPAITEGQDTPVEGSVGDAPPPASVAKSNLVEKEKNSNMYFSAVAFIYDIKKGPFWEHSPMLFDISGIKDGWGKINKGMIKMYNAEVLSKFPVVQHFPFGSLFQWEKDPNAKPPVPTTHTSSQPLRHPMDSHAPSSMRSTGPPPLGMGGGTSAPWTTTRAPPPPVGFVDGVTRAPWARGTPAPPPPRGGFNTQSRRPEPAIPEVSRPSQMSKESR